MSNPTLTPIYERLNGTDEYHPFTAETFADWASEAGDTVRIVRDEVEYAAPVHSQVISWHGHHKVTMESNGTKDREPIERTSNRKYASTSSGMSSARTMAGKTFLFEANESHLLYVVEDPTNGLVHNLEVTASSLTSEITRATEAEGGLQVDISSLEQDLNGVRTTVGTIEGQVQTLDGTVTTITGSALWTQRNDITGVVGEFDVVESGGVKTLVVKSGGGLSIRRNNVEFGVYDDGTLTAGVIATKVNGVASTNIYADKILMSSATGANNVAVEVNGKITANDITANFIQGKIAELSLLSAQALLVSGVITTYDGVVAKSVYANGYEITNPIMSASVSNNTLTLTKADGTSVTFSKATTLSGDWSGSYQAGKKFVVTASPQGDTCESPVVNSIGKYGNPTWAADEHSFDQQILVQDADANSIYLGSINVDGITKGTFSAVSLSTIKPTTAIRIDDTAVTLYEAGTTNKYDRGTSVTAKPIVQTGGSMYYPADTAVTLYNAGSETKYDRGDSITGREVLSSGGTFYYPAASAVTKYNAGTTTKTARGDSVTAKPIVSSGGTVYYKSGGTVNQTNQEVYKSAGPGAYYDSRGNFVANGSIYPSGAAVLYTSGGQVTIIDSDSGIRLGDSTTYYKGNGGDFTVQGSSTSITPINSNAGIRIGAAATYYKGNGGSFTPQGTSTTVTPIKSNSGIRLGDSAAYYTGDGGEFTPVGNAQDAYPKLASGGTIYYQGNAQATYYNKTS